MPCDLTDSNWLDSFKQKVTCGIGNIPVEQVRSAIIGLQIEALLCKCPDILDGDAVDCNIENNLTLSSILARIKCGVMLTDAEIAWSQANIYIKEKECCEIADAGEVADTFEIVAAGIFSWNGGAATTASIPVVGLLATDIVITTLIARASTETLILSVNDAANDQIDLTLSANGTNTTTKIAYQVLRANA
jgi:hypothetical protein